MSSLMDVLFSVVLGGMLILTIMNANDVALENSSLLVGDKMVQESAVSVSLYLDGEMRNMGFGVPDSQQVVLQADSTTLKYRVSLPPFDDIDTVMFYLGPVSELASTPNTQDRYLYRVENNGTPIPVAVLTYLRFRYIDRSDSLMNIPVSHGQLGQVFKVEVTTEVQNSYALYRPQSQVQSGQPDALYSSFLWNQTRLAAQNIRVAARPAQKIRPTRPPAPPTPPPAQGPSAPPRPPQPPQPRPAPAPAPGPRPVKPPPPPPPPPPPTLGLN
jgi:hypothetical protein